jgi:hypothetical protein
MATQIPQIEKYIRELIATNGGSFEREAILVQSKEWMEKFPVEFNSVLNMIEAEGRNVGCDEMMDDSTPSVAYGSRPGVESTPPVAPHHDEYSGNIMPDHISYVADSPMGSDHIDSSPGGYQDDDFESDMPLQRTMSCAPSRR